MECDNNLTSANRGQSAVAGAARLGSILTGAVARLLNLCEQRGSKVAFLGTLIAAAVALLLPAQDETPVLEGILIALVAAGVLVGLCYVAASLLRGRTDPLLLTWVALFPMGYYYLSFPRHKPLVTLDRVAITLLVIGSVASASARVVRVPAQLKRAALAWAGFIAVALLSVFYVKTPLSVPRLVLDAFLLPALLGAYVIRHFNVRAHLKTLHAFVCLVSVFCAGVGLAEILLQQDLMPFDNGTVTFVVAAGSVVIRANGPFETAASYSLIGVTSFVLLLFLRRAMGNNVASWIRAIHWIGVAAALLQSLLPLNRVMVLILGILTLVDAFLVHAAHRRLIRISALGIFAVGFVAMRMLAPVIYEERSSADNFYARIAQQRQSLALFTDHPFLGVGLTNFNEAVQGSEYRRTYRGVFAQDFPHNNVGAVLTETGLMGGGTLYRS